MEVLQPTRSKPFLGGFRHKSSRVEFHNASSQTKPVPLHWPTRTLFTRDTQTKQVSNQKIQTPQDTSTQMTKIGCYVSVKENRIHTPGKYLTSKEKEDVKLQKVFSYYFIFFVSCVLVVFVVVFFNNLIFYTLNYVLPFIFLKFLLTNLFLNVGVSMAMR